jgi:Cof subfamily protein (haloacid dehalogenase superfamily)
MLKPKLIFMDADGTLLDKLSIPKSALQAVRKAKRNGHRLFLATGRPTSEIGKDLQNLNFDGVISSNGAAITIGGEIAFVGLINPSVVKEILEFANQYNFGLTLETLSERFDNQPMRKSLKGLFEKAYGFMQKRPHINKLEGNLDRINQTLKVIVVSDQPEFESRVRSAFGECLEIFAGSIPFLKDISVEMTERNINKGSALKFVQKHLGFDISDTIALGDSANDIPMLEAAGYAVVMGNGTDDAKAAADLVTDSVSSDGLSNAFKKLGLI